MSSKKRFISLLFMALLGVGFYAGIKATGPDMLNTLDRYLDEQNVYDVKVVSTLGFDDENISTLKNNISDTLIYGIKEKDVIITLNETEKIIKISEINDSINKVVLTDGVMPSTNNEIVVEEKLLKDNDLNIGDNLIIEDENLNNSSFKIVGIIESPLYFTKERGTSNLGNGSVDYFVYATNDTFNVDYYSSIYLKSIHDELLTSTDEYEIEVEKIKNSVEELKEKEEKNRYNRVYKEYFENSQKYNIELDSSVLIPCEFYIFDRTSNQGYNDFVDATESLNKIGNVFPIVFYVIAILISLISMMRMIEEDRLEIGTLKALGFKNFEILYKYILYAFLATLFGSIIGMSIGFVLIPGIIWSIYTEIFNVPNFHYQFNLYYGSIGLVIALICICGATLFATYKELRLHPANLMRPKAPKNGKKVFLEHIHFIWNKLNFSNKVTVRNLFRYKTRVLVTILGITGSTALILAGFSLRDSITKVASNHENIFVYDKLISLKNYDSELIEFLMENENVSALELIYMKSRDLNYNNHNYKINMIVADDDNNLDDFIKLKDINNDYQEINLQDDSVVLSQKLAKTLDLKVNDKIRLDDNTEIEISNITENYINDYVYMNKTTYEKYFDNYRENTILVNVSFDDNLNQEILKYSGVSVIVDKKVTSDALSSMLDSLDSVVAVFIIAAALLTFVIMYNLSTINISERKREIATLKVLGFYDSEVDSYITRENVILTIIGIILGLIGGVYLSYYLISTCEPQFVMFVRSVEIDSYIISALISLCFMVIVNIITHNSLKHINMVESLKNVE